MTAAQFELIDETEAEAILRWRFEELVRAGYDIGSALVLASHVEIDLHDASALTRRGCPPETALGFSSSEWRQQAGAPMRRGFRPTRRCSSSRSGAPGRPSRQSQRRQRKKPSVAAEITSSADDDHPERLVRALAGEDDVHPEDAGDERQREDHRR